MEFATRSPFTGSNVVATAATRSAGEFDEAGYTPISLPPTSKKLIAEFFISGDAAG